MATHSSIYLHVIFGTKGRVPLIADSWQRDLFAYIGGTVKEHSAHLISAGGIEDHVHLLLKTHPKHSVSSTVQLLKQNSSRWNNKQELVQCKFQWQRGFGVFSVSKSLTPNVSSYLKRQRKHHSTQSFDDEYLETLRKHEIEFDERFVFEQEIYG